MFCPKCRTENPNTAKFCKGCGKSLPDYAQIVAKSQQVQRTQGGLLGQVLDGKYRIDAKLGAGGMGDVYRATRLMMGDTVAIKTLHSHLAQDAEAAERFRREAVTATKLRHKNVVTIYDVGVSAQHRVPYILMEMAEGYTLRQIINENSALPLDFAVTVVAQVCAALTEAHNIGIIHRDIKPENIVANQTTTGWHVKVLDFGIAKLFDQADSDLTQDGSALGTPQYMSPEQCLGDHLDARSDIYSIGITIYEMLCGKPPFSSIPATAISVHQVQTAPTPPTQINPQIQKGIEVVILKALSKKRENRQQSANELAQEFIRAATEAFKSGVEPKAVEAPDAIPISEDIEEVAESADPNLASVEVIPAVADVQTDFEEPQEENLANSGKNENKESKQKTAADVEEQEADQEEKSSAPLQSDPPVDSDPDEQEDSIAGEDTEDEQLLEIEEDREVNASAESNEVGEDLSGVFEEAEHVLDEILSGKKSDSESEIATSIERSEIGSDPGIAETVQVPVVETPPEVIAIAKPESESDPLIDESGAISDVETDVNWHEKEYDVAKSTPETELKVFDEIGQPSGSNRFLFVIAAAIVGFVFLFGVVGAGAYWLFVSGEPSTSENTNSNSSPQNAAPEGMVFVPGGEFVMGSDDRNEFSRPAHKVTVKPFFIDLTEVTNAEYKKFVDAEKYRPPPQWKDGRFPDGEENFPVSNVNWDDATAFAKWKGKRLPTEEEWEFAAKGQGDLRYPWGNDWKKGYANAASENKGFLEVGKMKGKSPFGVFDMAGNGFEWTNSDAKPYPGGKDFYNSTRSPKIIRGGFWGSDKDEVTTTYRASWGARNEKSYENTTFRCARD